MLYDALFVRYPNHQVQYSSINLLFNMYAEDSMTHMFQYTNIKSINVYQDRMDYVKIWLTSLVLFGRITPCELIHNNPLIQMHATVLRLVYEICTVV